MTTGGTLERGLRATAKAVFSSVDLLLGAFAGPRLLIYHQIEAGLGRQMEVRAEAFRAHLDWIAGHGSVVDLETAIARRGEPGAGSLFALTFDDGYQDFYRSGFPLLRARRLPFSLFLATKGVETGSAAAPGAEPLTWDQVGEMLETGLMTLGSHTHTHPDLRHLDESAATDELDTADRLIRTRLGVEVGHFAYPYGYWSPSADKAVRARYTSAVLGGGPPIGPDTDRFLLHRLPVQLSDGVVFFRRKMRRGQRAEEWLRRRLSGYRGP